MLAVVAWARPVNAQFTGSSQPSSGDVVVQELGLLTSAQIEQEIARLEEQRNDITLAGPWAGVGIATILVPGGAFMIGAGAAMRSIETELFCPSYDPVCGEPSAGSKAMTAVCVAVLVGGIVGVILTSRKVKRSKEQRDRIDRKINGLERSLPNPRD